MLNVLSGKPKIPAPITGKGLQKDFTDKGRLSIHLSRLVILGFVNLYTIF
jgi:hypothetical protein